MNRKWDCSLQSVLRFSNSFSLNKVWNKLLWFLPTLQFPLCQLHFCLPFSQPFQKISGDQVAEIQNEKDRMKDRRSKRRKEGRAQKLEKTFCRMQPMGIFSAHWKGPIRLSSQPRLCSGSSFLFPLFAVRLKAPYGNDSRGSGHSFGPRPHFPEPLQRPAESFFLWVPAGPYLQSKQQMLQRWANVQVRKTTLIKRCFLMKSWWLFKKRNA